MRGRDGRGRCRWWRRATSRCSLICVAARLTFGFELSWMESGMQAMTDRLAAHQPIYAAPSPSYVPFIYPPLYYVVAHAVDRFAFGAADGSLAAMRLVSAIATLGTAVSVYAGLERRRALPARLRLALAALPLAFYGRFELAHQPRRQPVRAADLRRARPAGRGARPVERARRGGGRWPGGAHQAAGSAAAGGRRRDRRVRAARIAAAPLALATAAIVVVAGLAARGELGDPGSTTTWSRCRRPITGSREI